MTNHIPFQFNFPKLRQLAKDIREATRRERRFNWDEFDLDQFFDDCERARLIFEAEERRQREAEDAL
jgi:hypothetical protein